MFVPILRAVKKPYGASLSHIWFYFVFVFKLSGLDTEQLYVVNCSVTVITVFTQLNAGTRINTAFNRAPGVYSRPWRLIEFNTFDQDQRVSCGRAKT